MHLTLALSSVLSLVNLFLKGGSQYLIIFLISQYLTLEQVGEYKAYVNISVLLWIICKLGMDQTFYRWASSDWNSAEIHMMRRLILKIRIVLSAVFFLLVIANGYDSASVFIWASSTNLLVRSFYTDAYFPAMRMVQHSVRLNTYYFGILLLIIIYTLTYEAYNLLLILSVYEFLFCIAMLVYFRSHLKGLIDWQKIKLLMFSDDKIKKFISFTFITSVGSINTYKLIEVYIIGKNLNFTLSGEFVIISVFAALALSVSPANIARPIILPFLRSKHENSKYIHKIFYWNLLYSAFVLLVFSSDYVSFRLKEYFNLSVLIYEALPIIFLSNFFLAQIAFITIIMVRERQISTTMFGVILTMVGFIIGPLILTELNVTAFLSIPALLSGFLLLIYLNAVYMMGYGAISIYLFLSAIGASTFVLVELLY